MDSRAVLWVFLCGLVILVLRNIANNRAQRRVSCIRTSLLFVSVLTMGRGISSWPKPMAASRLPDYSIGGRWGSIAWNRYSERTQNRV